jgi:glycosyltransferase involved in cell wall biosynthesis
MLVVARLLNLPSVLSLHGSDVSSVPFTANYDWALRIACRMAQSVTTCSDYLKTRVLDVVGTEAVAVTAVPNGFDDPSDTDRRPVDAPYVAVVSRLVPKKGIEVALESVRLLLDRGVQVRLVVAGEGPCRADLERRIVELGIGDSVALPGHLEGEDLHGLVRHSLFQLVPSHWESFGVVCLEGMAAGKAIVASRVGGIPDIVRDGETGILVPPSDPVALADAVATLLADPDLARRLGEAGRKRAHEEFTWERMTDRYEEALAHVERRGTGAAIGARGEETA